MGKNKLTEFSRLKVDRSCVYQHSFSDAIPFDVIPLVMLFQKNKLNRGVNMHTIFGLKLCCFPDFKTKCKGTRGYQTYELKGADNLNLNKILYA